MSTNAPLPTENGLYRGNTYTWELEDGEWTPQNAPYGVYSPAFDAPLTPYYPVDMRSFLEWMAFNYDLSIDPDEVIKIYRKQNF